MGCHEDQLRCGDDRSGAGFGKWSGHGSVVFKDRIWVIAGREGESRKFVNDVWYSSDGVAWTQASVKADFPARMEPSLVSFRGKLWLTGGFDWKGMYNDLWTSADGVKWTRVILHAPFDARRYQDMEVLDGKLWIIGGYNGSGGLSDVWYTVDGTSWTQATSDAAFGPRYRFSLAAFHDRLWVIGGSRGGLSNDVWYSGRPDTENPADDSSGLEKTRPGPVAVTKTCAPSSIKEDTDTRVTITIRNNGQAPVHDIDVLDIPEKEFLVAGGITRYSFDQIGSGDARILTYTMRAKKPGSYQLNRTTVMYADQDGNYSVVYSDYGNVRVLSSLPGEPQEHASHGFFGDLAAWLNGINPFA